MRSVFDDIFLDNLPTLDLHGEYRFSARVLINDFINDNYFLKNYKILIIHGIGSGALKEETNEVLKKNKLVDSFHISMYNKGCTIVYLKQNQHKIS